MVLTVSGGRVVSRDVVTLEIDGVFDLIDAVARHRIDTLVCGGIDRDTKDGVLSVVSEVVDNVACPADEIPPALENGTLAPGFRLSGAESATSDNSAEGRGDDGRVKLDQFDCLLCRDRVCLRGPSCLAAPASEGLAMDPVNRRMIETTFDISQEKERKLCRIAETVYFCLEMDYRRIGIAFCTELLEPARILSGVLRRFFEVVPVCCKAGVVGLDDLAASAAGDRSQSSHSDVCNPLAQAEILNLRQTDFNLAVGLCVGSDSLFAQASHAPVSTLFVKDRSLANNPIGALYSDYYLRESIAPAGRALSTSYTLNQSVSIKEEI